VRSTAATDGRWWTVPFAKGGRREVFIGHRMVSHAVLRAVKLLDWCCDGRTKTEYVYRNLIGGLLMRFKSKKQHGLQT